MTTNQNKNYLDDEIIAYQEDEDLQSLDGGSVLQEKEEPEEGDSHESSVNIPLSGSPLYPRIFVGDSAKPLQGQFPESEYVDDNISRTWTGLLTSFFG